MYPSEGWYRYVTTSYGGDLLVTNTIISLKFLRNRKLLLVSSQATTADIAHYPTIHRMCPYDMGGERTPYCFDFTAIG